MLVRVIRRNSLPSTCQWLACLLMDMTCMQRGRGPNQKRGAWPENWSMLGSKRGQTEGDSINGRMLDRIVAGLVHISRQ